MARIGIYDSGRGGLALIPAIEAEVPGAIINYFHDPKNFPYGNKTREELLGLAVANLQKIVEAECDVAVIGCNTLTTNTIKKLREKFNLPIVGVEPPVKPASESGTKVITTFATSATLNSVRYRELKRRYGKNIRFVEPDSSGWIERIENGDYRDVALEMVREVSDAGVVVLGCTHFIHLVPDLKKLTDVPIFEPSAGVARRVKQLLGSLS